MTELRKDKKILPWSHDAASAPGGGPAIDGASTDRPRRKGAKSARDAAMDYLARRGHSALELQQKLSRKYEPKEVAEAIQFARENGWMPSPEELSERVSVELARKRRGHRYIAQYLRGKGLPPAPRDSEAELDKARAFADSRLAHSYPYDYEEQKKLARWLSTRGFDDDVIRRVLFESPKAT